jgi:catechol 2,3-dioxygenase-like lactoylglutathione lyase family enzyme
MRDRASGRKERVRAMPNMIGVRHVGLPAKNLAALKAFYQDVLGMTVVRETSADASFGATLFLVHPGGEEDHDLVFFADPMAAHTAFEVASVAELKTAYREVKARGVPIKMALNHGVQLSFYFEDPEGHLIEIYWLTPVRILPGLADPIDLDLPEEELRREVERTARRFGAPAPATAS